MENKSKHIDDFLDTKLGNFSAMPYSEIWHVIKNNIQQLNHPIDAGLNIVLSNLEESPNTYFSKNFIAELPQKINVIDFALHQSLSQLEPLPNEKIWNNISKEITPKRKRRFIAWLWFLPLFAFILIGYNAFNYILKQEISTKNISTLFLNKKQKKETTNSTLLSNQNYEILPYPALKKTKKKLIPNGKNHTPNSELYNTEIRPLNPLFLLSEVDATLLIPLNYRIFTFEKNIKDTLEYFKIEKLNKTKLLPKKLSPFSFSIMGGYLNSSTINYQIKTENVHKDALTLFENTTGKSSNGKQYSLLAGYRYKRFIDFRIGLNYMQLNAANNVQYIYNQVPLYNAKGEIFAYGTRPNNSSPQVNQKAVNKTKNLSIPIQVSTMLMQTNKISVWGGFGAEFILQKNNNVQLFSFDNGQMETLSSNQLKTQKIIPNAQILFNYQYKPQWHFLFQIQTAYQSKNYYIDQIHYQKTELLPALKFGLQFNPLIN